MPTLKVEIVENQIIVGATIAVPPDGPKSDPFPALVDTGAQVTMISRNVVETLGADPVGKSVVSTVSGDRVETLRYRLGIYITVGLGHSGTFSSGMDLDVLLLPFDPPNFDVLLGMDLLTGFHATMHGGHFILSN